MPHRRPHGRRAAVGLGDKALHEARRLARDGLPRRAEGQKFLSVQEVRRRAHDLPDARERLPPRDEQVPREVRVVLKDVPARQARDPSALLLRPQRDAHAEAAAHGEEAPGRSEEGDGEYGHRARRLLLILLIVFICASHHHKHLQGLHETGRGGRESQRLLGRATRDQEQDEQWLLPSGGGGRRRPHAREVGSHGEFGAEAALQGSKPRVNRQKS
mmetsp:Transcript_23095/g.49171  ORF Transcript_23095/g.49171 Transcript_23095/m.49171 type:complete len:216 (+) Transcript_23095:1039-1686(+)